LATQKSPSDASLALHDMPYYYMYLDRNRVSILTLQRQNIRHKALPKYKLQQRNKTSQRNHTSDRSSLLLARSTLASRTR